MVCHLRYFYLRTTPKFSKRLNKTKLQFSTKRPFFMQMGIDIWLLHFYPQKCHAMTIGVRKNNLSEYSLQDVKGGESFQIK